MAAEEPSPVDLGTEERLTVPVLVTNDGEDAHIQSAVPDEDMITQALVDAAEFPEGVQIQYTDEGVELPEGSMITTNNEGVTFITSDGMDHVPPDQLAEQFANGTYQVLTTGQVVGPETNFTTVMNEEVPLSNGGQGLEADTGIEFQKLDGGMILTTEQAASLTQNSEQLKTVVAIPQGASVNLTSSAPAPLGSSQNPIRIIQQGNQYTPVQQLSTDQLQQIMQVVQQQQMQNSLEGGGSSVLFNPQTNTRIVYRVIYPSELHKDKTSVTNSMQTAQSIQTTPKKVYRKRHKEEETEAREGPSLSKEEKEIRKKAKSKTRSGRVSKPPKHMVKDFKHIHVLDYDEDYDDSDGGYSDYKVGQSDDDDDQSLRDENEPVVIPGLNATKPKNWKCVTCEKAYIGRAGLGRHLKLNPTHGSIDVDGDGDMVPPPPGTEIIMNGTSSTDTTPTVTLTNGTANGTTNGTANSTASLSEDSRDSSYSLPYTPTPTRRGNTRGRPRGSRGWRGRWAYNKMDPESRRRSKLKDLVRECTDEELMEIVLPRLAKVITLWEFLLMKVESGDPARPHVDDVYAEYEKLHTSVQKLCQEYLQFVPDTDTITDKKILHVENPVIATALGLQTGAHTVKDIPDEDPSVTYKYKLLTTNQAVVNKPLLKRTVEVVSPEQIVSPSKKLKNGPIKLEVPDSPVKGNVSNDTQPVFVSNDTQSVLVSNDTQPVLVSLSSSTALSQPAGMTQTSTVNSSVTMSNPSTKHVLNIQPQSSINTSYTKAVSLLTNSIIKSPNFRQKSSTQTSQKFILVSGLNPSQNIASVTGPQSILYQADQSKPADKQLVPVSQNIILQAGIPDTIQAGTPLQTTNSVQPSAIQTPNSTIQQLYFTLPASSTQTQQSVEYTAQPVYQISPQQNNILTSISEDSKHSLVLGEDGKHSLVLGEDGKHSLVLGEDGKHSLVLGENGKHSLVLKQSSQVSDSATVTQSLSNTDSNSVLANLQHIEQSLASQNTELSFNQSGNVNIHTDTVSITSTQSETKSSESKPSINTDQILGVTSIDNSDTTGQIQTVCEPMEHDSQPDQTSDLSAQIYQNSEPTVSLTLQDTDVKYVNETSDQTQALTLQNTNVKFVNETSDQDHSQTELYQPEIVTEDQDETETVQVPATNIYQLEDGSFFIQNEDGTLIQLQSSDGQNVSMEAVQAFLANSGGGAQFVGNTDINSEQAEPT